MSAALLRRATIGAGAAAAALFVVVGLAFELQTYGDGSIFSYSVAVGDVWAFHWRNIVARATVWFINLWPGEMAGVLTGDPRVAVLVYGVASFSAQAAGLAATYFADRTPRRTFFVFACGSTACLVPLVFGFPSEMLLAHALFWPTFAVAFGAPNTRGAAALLFALMLALVFAHEAALGLAFGAPAALVLRGWRDPTFLRAFACFVVVVAIWLVVDRAFPPDAYFAEVRVRAAREFFEARSLAFPLLIVIAVALAGYFTLALGLRAPALACAATLVALVVWWSGFDTTLHADSRYYARTILLLFVCAFAAVAALIVLRDEGGLVSRLPILNPVLARIAGADAARAWLGALVVLLTIHVVETAKFARAWSVYRVALRALATGEAADPQLGAPFFVSSRRIGADVNRLAWFSTTPYLSALVADFRPTRLAIDPAGNYFWISCATAAANAARENIVPRETREMIRVYACANKR